MGWQRRWSRHSFPCIRTARRANISFQNCTAHTHNVHNSIHRSSWGAWKVWPPTPHFKEMWTQVWVDGLVKWKRYLRKRCTGPTCRKVIFNAIIIQETRLCRKLDYRKHCPLQFQLYANALNKQSLIRPIKQRPSFCGEIAWGQFNVPGNKHFIYWSWPWPCQVPQPIFMKSAGESD